MLNEEGQIVGWETGLKETMDDYFMKLFEASETSWNAMFETVTRKINVVQNQSLVSQVTLNEVKKALFGMHPDRSPGPDGFSPGFYQKFRSIISTDLLNLVRQFFVQGKLENDIGDANIVLIPKVKNPSTMRDLRPISLCNVVYKVISKVLSNRLKPLLNMLISENQSAFIPRRLITDNIMISYEVMHFMKRKTQGKLGWMALKLDMSKAYDRVEWFFLRKNAKSDGVQ